jgi:hypothetical protein
LTARLLLKHLKHIHWATLLRRKLLLSGLVLFVLLCFSVVPSVGASSMWSQTYGGTGGSMAHSVIATPDGGYALAGYTGSFGANGVDFWLVKTDAFGNMQWNKTYGGTGADAAWSLVATSDGGYALAGKWNYTTYHSEIHDGDCWLVKTDASGNMEWNKTYEGTEHLGEHTGSLVATSDGGYALAGYTSSFGDGGGDFWLVKTDASGNMEWNKTYGGTQFESASSVIATSDGGYALAGYTSSFEAGGGSDFWLVKTDALGNMEWNRKYGGTRVEGASMVIATPDGGYALAGSTQSAFGSADADFWLVKTDSSGNMEWNGTYGGTSFDFASSLVATSDGGYALAGRTESHIAGYSDFWLVKTDASGNMQWNQTYGGTGDNWAYSLVATSDGGYAIAGETSNFGPGSCGFWLVKTDEFGVVPEFSSWFAPLLVLAAAVPILIYRKRLLRTRS